MSIFRQSALDALSSPEKLDQPLQLLRPSQWLLLLSLGGFCTAILIWSICGRLPVRIDGRGVLVRKNSLTQVQSEINGQVQSLSVQVGDCVEQGQQMARVDPVRQETEQDQAKIRLQQLISQDKQEDELGEIRLDQLEDEITRIKGLATIGALSLDDINRRNKELSSLKDNLTSRNSQREREITMLKTRIRSLGQEIARTATIRAPLNGCVIDRSVNQGEVVQSGSTMFFLDTQPNSTKLDSLAFFRAGDGKRLSPGQRVRITPDSAKQQRHGGIEGTVLAIRNLPVTEQALVKRLGQKSLLDSVRANTQGALIEVVTTLERDPSTVSGFNWGGGPGPDLKLTAGTPTAVRVLVEERRPISYVIPILRDLTGIY